LIVTVLLFRIIGIGHGMN